MRLLSPTISALIAAGDVEVIYLLRITDSNGVPLITSTTFYSDVTLSNGYVYVSNGLLVGADPPQLSTTVDREQYKVTMADPEFNEGPYADNGFIGKIMEVRLGFINPATGLPFTTVAETFTVYKGRLDGTSYRIAMVELGEALLQIIGTSPMASLDMAQPFYLSKDEVRQRNIDDACADSIYEGSSTTALKWGKK
jgi:hypothetical protein